MTGQVEVKVQACATTATTKAKWLLSQRVLWPAQSQQKLMKQQVLLLSGISCGDAACQAGHPTQ